MRLIDADLVIDTVNEFKGKNRKTDLGIKLVEEIVSNAPTVDAEPVVRCKDCKYYREQGYCSRFDLNNQCPATPYSAMHMPMDADDFCSRGEAK